MNKNNLVPYAAIWFCIQACFSSATVSPDQAVRPAWNTPAQAGQRINTDAMTQKMEWELIAQKARPRVNVRDLGARGDGKTNDTSAFQKAADMLTSATGGVLVIPPGTYIVGRQKHE